ncbi:pseudouridine synthase [Mycoplasma phocoenae]|uniref:rRNA pseudouridine synthase n=1 Tax=Mycoplasma phocoenae TaxID=754517 RepID=A0A858U4D8_9MOLU|nr:pseudouridine synthase [Mycoplasma phocoenae]QJG66939.1 rRNA pseudouridine synthase [Mycoplasma phocoenae]
MRIEKLIGHMTSYSRQDIKKLIKKGLVFVNGNQIKTSVNVKENTDIIEINKQKITYKEHQYFLFNKPKYCITANYDKFNKTIFDFIELDRDKFFAYGRLDYDAQGLLIISNDGDLGHKLLSKKYHVPKLYYVETTEPIDPQKIIAHGQNPIVLDDGTIIDEYEFTEITPAYLRLIIYQGVFHQVKKMLNFFDYEVSLLKREKFGSQTLDKNLGEGQYRELTDTELLNLKKCTEKK